jgi:hypothetical protein
MDQCLEDPCRPLGLFPPTVRACHYVCVSVPPAFSFAPLTSSSAERVACSEAWPLEKGPPGCAEGETATKRGRHRNYALQRQRTDQVKSRGTEK